MPPMDPPKQAILIPNTQPIYCQFHSFCRGGVAAYLLARGPARNLWIPLCQHCAEQMARQAPDRLIRVTVEGAIERGALRFVQEPLSAHGATALAPPAGAATAPVTREDALAYLAAHASDTDLLEAIADILGDGDADESTDQAAAENQPAPSPPAPGETKKPTAKATTKTTTRKPAHKPGRR